MRIIPIEFVSTGWLFIVWIVSPDCNPIVEANDPDITSSIWTGRACVFPLMSQSVVSLSVLLIKKLVFVKLDIFSGMIMSGFAPVANRYTKTRYANNALTVTPAMRMIIFLTMFAVMKLSGARNDGSCGFSPLSLTNPPSGIQLSVYCVPDLSCRSFLSLGGIPIPNSRTLTPLSLAAVKCPSSWMMTRNINMAIPMMIQIITYFLSKYSSLYIVFCYKKKPIL